MIPVAELLKGLYNKIGSVITTGIPIVIIRKWRIVQITRVGPPKITQPKEKIKKQKMA